MDLLLDETDGDLDVTGGELALVSGPAETRQRLELSLGLGRGDWFLDLGEGVPYLERVLRKGADPEEIRGLLRSRAEADPDVVSASVRLDLDPGPRRARATVTARLRDGSTVDAVVRVVRPGGGA